MGGHGGLNILPQKSWNVYNVKNQNIVRRDEERFRREQAEAERQAQREQSEVRLSKLRENNGTVSERFNLFEEEEKKANEYEKKRRQAEIEKKEKDKDTWYLGKVKPTNSWYERPAKLDCNGPEIRRQTGLDPMNLINSMLSKPERSSRRQDTSPEKSQRSGHKSKRARNEEAFTDREKGHKKHRSKKKKGDRKKKSHNGVLSKPDSL